MVHSRSRSRERHRRSRSRDKHRRSRSRSRSPRGKSPGRRTNRDKDSRREKERDSRRDRDFRKSRSRSRDKFGELVVVKRRRERDKKEKEQDGEELAPLTDDQQAIMKIMGFSGFDSTKNKGVQGNMDGFVANVNKERKYRQYMNRRGGFNRSLDPIA